ncbi:MAG TPA: sigma 54-interacting transcriptional regulator [Candidatus Deferrimicrobium sp.]|nr:sigma 54-interacting transcriptional regulator [Candidatus Deferrimicrobium sp.]
MKSLQAIEELVRNKRYCDALNELKNIDVAGLGAAEIGHHSLLTAEASLYLGDYSVGNLIDEVIEKFRGSERTDIFAWAKFLKGWLLSALSRHAEAQEVLLEAHVNFLRCRDLKGSARALNQLSYVLLILGHLESSISNLRKCIDIYCQLHYDHGATVASSNLAYLLFMTGAIRESRIVYADIAERIESTGEKNVLIYTEMFPLPLAYKGDIATARKTIAKCRPYLDKYIREKAIYYENLGLICILDRDYPAAEKALKAGLEISIKIAPESALVSQIKRLFGDLYVATNKFQLAEQFASEALVVAEKINERVEIAACHRVFAQVEAHRGDADKARQWYGKAMDMFNLVGSRYELAVTRYLAATSGLHAETERTAMLYLAREYFAAEDVTHYVDKIDAQLRVHVLPPAKTKTADAARPVVVAVSPAMKKIVALVENIAPSEMTVLLSGATGTGKDLFARYVHYCSGRTGKLVIVNMATIPDALAEAELFGCTKGAFTGSEDRPGLIAEAAEGTLFLNEVAEASSAVQAKLLEVLETRCVRRLGENERRAVNFRLIAASSTDVQELLRIGRLRLDLYHRLNQIPIVLSPLDARREDIPALVRHFLTFAGFDLTGGNETAISELGELLSQWSWPGNVRQLQALVQRLWTEAGQDSVKILQRAREQEQERQREDLEAAIVRSGGNQSRAAELLGVSEGTVRHRRRKLGL